MKSKLEEDFSYKCYLEYKKNATPYVYVDRGSEELYVTIFGGDMGISAAKNQPAGFVKNMAEKLNISTCTVGEPWLGINNINDISTALHKIPKVLEYKKVTILIAAHGNTDQNGGFIVLDIARSINKEYPLFKAPENCIAYTKEIFAQFSVFKDMLVDLVVESCFGGYFHDNAALQFAPNSKILTLTNKEFPNLMTEGINPEISKFQDTLLESRASVIEAFLFTYAGVVRTHMQGSFNELSSVVGTKEERVLQIYDFKHYSEKFLNMKYESLQDSMFVKRLLQTGVITQKNLSMLESKLCEKASFSDLCGFVNDSYKNAVLSVKSLCDKVISQALIKGEFIQDLKCLYEACKVEFVENAQKTIESRASTWQFFDSSAQLAYLLLTPNFKIGEQEFSENTSHTYDVQPLAIAIILYEDSITS